MKGGILILDFGSQYTQLIARKVRELEVYAEIVPFNIPIEEVKLREPMGFILSGGPSSVLFSSEKSEPLTRKIDELVRFAPVLGICYGMQMICKEYGGEIKASQKGEYGLSQIQWKNSLSKKIPLQQKVWMSYGDSLRIPPPGFEILAFSETGAPSVIRSLNLKILAFQFHPEVSHTEGGIELLKFFLFDYCHVQTKWKASNLVQRAIEEIRNTVPKNENVLAALSGGIDSTVVALLLRKALGDKRVDFVFVDTGLLREGEFDEVMNFYSKLKLNVEGINSKSFFLKKLAKISSPERKRKVIGSAFIQVFKFFIQEKKSVKWLAQGTLYPDVVESSSSNEKGKVSTTIKSHHNVGGLPKNLNLKLLEPLREFFKDEVRKMGKELKISKEGLSRHPFPGPGLAIRILGSVTEKKLDIVRKCDAIFIEELKNNDLYSSTWQALTVLLPVKSVGIQGDQRTYKFTLVLRAVSSLDGMTANWVHFPLEFLDKVSRKITNEVKDINRVVYDITNKPPGTIEWE